MEKSDVILSLNAGSSNIKFAVYATQPALKLLHHGTTKTGLKPLLAWLDASSKTVTVQAIGHRIVHGGTYLTNPVVINDDVIHTITRLTPLAPLHQTQGLNIIQIMKRLYPNIPQVACFDTAFHRTQHTLASYFALPRKLTDSGIIRYGFHGISYEYVSSVLQNYLGDIGKKRVIVAHLGNGASMCAMIQGKSVATTMSFTALDGLMMGTRCGAIDPGVILYLLQEKQYSIEQINTLLYHESGLLGVSGISDDMKVLESCQEPKAAEAIDLFCYKAAKELSALCVSIQGCDAIVFTAGIGEKSALVRRKICEQLAWLGIVLDNHANTHHLTLISQKNSRILVSIIPTNEEYVIAKHTKVISIVRG